jgi:hypothetical protein
MDIKNKLYEKWLDLLWGMLIHNRDNETCQWCGKHKNEIKIDAHHIFGRIAKATRWNSSNGILLCYLCHNWRLKKDFEGFRGIATLKVGLDKYLELYRLFLTPAKYINYMYIEDSLIKELERLKVTIPKKPRALSIKK